MPQPLKLQIKPEWDGATALAGARRLTDEMEKQKKLLAERKKWGSDFGSVFGEVGTIDDRRRKAAMGGFFSDLGARKQKEGDAAKAFAEAFSGLNAAKQKKWDDFLKRNQNGLDRMRQSARALHGDMKTAFSVSTFRGLDFALTKTTTGIGSIVSKVFSLQNLLIGGIGGGIIGGLLFGLGQKALKGGMGNVRDDARLRREFKGATFMGPLARGGEYESQGLYDSLVKQANSLASSAGIESGDAVTTLLPIARAIKETKIGSRLRSGKKLTSQKQVDLIQQQTLGIASNYAKRLLTLFPESSKEDIGRILAEAGTGEEGVGSLGRFVGLGRASMADLMAEAKKKKLPIGNLVGNVLERAGITDDAALEKTKTFEFQIQSISSQLNDALGNVGTSAIEKLNKALGSGTTLAEKLQKYLSSDAGKKMIDEMGQALSSVVSFAAELAKDIPKVIGYLVEHKDTIRALAGIWGGEDAIKRMNKEKEDDASKEYKRLAKEKQIERNDEIGRVMQQYGLTRGQAINKLDRPEFGPSAPPPMNFTLKVGEKELAVAVSSEAARQQTNEARNQAGM